LYSFDYLDLIVPKKAPVRNVYSVGSVYAIAGSGTNIRMCTLIQESLCDILPHVLAASQYSPTPSIDRLRAWIVRPDLFASDGRVLSWLSDDRTGYPYDEATVLLARAYQWLGWTQRSQRVMESVVQRLTRDHSLGRDGIQYVFDTSLALWLLPEPQRVADHVLHELHARRACQPIRRPGWWSQSYGAHLIKCAGPLTRLGLGADVRPVVDDLVDRCFDGQRFRIHGDSNATYVHSHCYALEGLLQTGYHPEIVQRGADWLAELQGMNGELPAWIETNKACWPSDIVAQSIRIWTLVNPRRYGQFIQRGLGCLAARQDPDHGAIAYQPDHAHWNVWSTIFALQACTWAQSPPTQEQRQWLI